MTTLQRRDALRLDLPEWVSRWFDERGLAERIGMTTGGVRVEEFDDGDVHVVRAELPGIDPAEDVSVSVHDGVLDIRGERTEREEADKDGSYRTEFHYGAFQRLLPLPAGATAGDVVATYTDGVLEVRVPVEGRAAEPTTIAVTRG